MQCYSVLLPYLFTKKTLYERPSNYNVITAASKTYSIDSCLPHDSANHSMEPEW